MNRSEGPDGRAPGVVPDHVVPFVRHIDPWISCDDCFEMIDEFVQGFVDDGTGLPHALRIHLNDCEVCLEEAETLIALLEADEHRDANAALARFHADLTARRS